MCEEALKLNVELMHYVYYSKWKKGECNNAYMPLDNLDETDPSEIERTYKI